MRLVFKAIWVTIFALIAAISALRWATAPLDWQQSFDVEHCCVDIAHAGGLLNGVAYTNSREALEANFAAGRRIFEIDLIETSDAQIVLGHDWDDFEGKAPTLATYRQANPELTLMTFVEFAAWAENTCIDCKIVTDTKMPLQDFLDLYQQVIPQPVQTGAYVLQTYGAADLDLVTKTMPSQPIILTTYLLDDLSDALLSNAAAEPNLIAITMPADRALTQAADVAAATGKPVFTHGPPWLMRSVLALKLGRAVGVTGFYRD